MNQRGNESLEHLKKAAFCEITADPEYLQQEIAELVGFDISCAVVFKAIKSHTNCLKRPSQLRQTFVVNLARREDKWREFVSHSSAKNVSFTFVRHEAVDGLKMSLTASVKRLFDPPLAAALSTLMRIMAFDVECWDAR